MSTPATLPPLPRRPADEECCDRGCSPCIFDYYDKAVARWRDRVRALGVDPDGLAEQPAARPRR